MIFPDRVLGSDGAQWITSGVASAPMPRRTCWTNSSRSDALPVTPCFKVTYA